MSKPSLYVVCLTAEGTKWSKVGKSIDVASRLKAIRRDTPFEVSLVKVYKDHGDRETQVLAKLAHAAPRGSSGEWFKIAPGKVCALVEQVLLTDAYPSPGPVAPGSMVMKTSYYSREQLDRLRSLSKSLGVTDADILREALEARLVRDKA